MMRLTLSLVIVAGCASSARIPAARFINAPPVEIVDDRRDVPSPPRERRFLHELYHYDGTFQRRLTRALSLPRSRRALGVNAIDEVPDSTWFTNRIGRRDLSVAEIARGATTIDSPEAHTPWTIRKNLIGGSEGGLIIVDARGTKFLLKLDDSEFPEEESTAHVVTGRLLWAAGYHTTEDFVVHIRPEDLVLASDAYLVDALGHRSPFRRAELERRLARVAREPDGSLRGMASRWLDGVPLGGHPATGVRSDDPNDRIPHELRRDLRGLRTFAAWLDHVDIQESNFLDTWVQDARGHHVEHYLLDFGKSLGVMATTGRDPRHGFEYVVDPLEIARAFVTGGIGERPWEDRDVPALRGVGMFDARTFDPGAWKPGSPAYVPFLTSDRFDQFWAAKIIMRFTRPQIRAAVEAARLHDRRATEYLVDTLVARQRATGEYWFRRVAPLDNFAIGDGLCFDDLAIHYGFVSAATYEVSTFDRRGELLGAAITVPAGAGGRTCSGRLTTARLDDGYTIVEIVIHRRDFTGRTLIHLALDPRSHTPRVIGVWR